MMNKDKATEEAIRVITGKGGENLVEYLYNTPPDKLLEMSVLGRGQALNISMVLALKDLREYYAQMSAYLAGEQYANEEGDMVDVPEPKPFYVIDRWVFYYLQSTRSIGGETLKSAKDMAQAKVETSGAGDEFADETGWKDDE